MLRSVPGVPARYGCAFTLALAWSVASVAAAAEIRVPEDHGTIQEAVDAAADGDTVLVAPRVYTIRTPIDFNRFHDPRDPASPPLKNITLRSTAGPEATIIRVQSPLDPFRASVMIFDKGESRETVVEGFTLSGGRGTAWGPNPWQFGGAGVVCDSSSPTFIRCAIVENSVREEFARGGGIVCWQSSPRFLDCTVSRNFAQFGGGAVFSSGPGTEPEFRECRFDLNFAGSRGGALLFEAPSQPTVTDCVISRNQSNVEAGGVLCAMQTVVRNSSIVANESPFGSGLILLGASRLEGSNVSDNNSEGVVVGEASTVTIEGSTISGNRNGGVLCFAEGRVDLVGCTISGNRAERGGGLLLDNCAATVTDCEIRGNFASDSGGGIYLSATSPDIDRCTIAENACEANGAGLVCERSSPLITRTVFEGNSSGELVDAEPLFSWGGGGVFTGTGSSPIFLRCTFTGNVARFGGGLTFVAESSGTLENCLIAGNFARFEGGGVFIFATTAVSLVHCTVAGNGAETNGGISCAFSNPQVMSSIVWGNLPNTTCGEIGTSLSRFDPQFVEPGDYDFEAFETVPAGLVSVRMPRFVLERPDYRLQRSSPAVDAALPSLAPPEDLDGRARPCGAAPDLGAYELCGPRPNRFIRGNTDADDRTTLGDAIVVLNLLFLGGAQPPCLKSADVDDNGIVNLTDPVALLEHLFLGGAPPRAPFPECGEDLTDDVLPCRESMCE